jgi:hypothetical protein
MAMMTPIPETIPWRMGFSKNMFLLSKRPETELMKQIREKREMEYNIKLKYFSPSMRS